MKDEMILWIAERSKWLIKLGWVLALSPYVWDWVMCGARNYQAIEIHWIGSIVGLSGAVVAYIAGRCADRLGG